MNSTTVGHIGSKPVIKLDDKMLFKQAFGSFRTIELEKCNDTERAIFLTLRIITLIILIILLMLHMKYMRVFRWEQSVTGGVLITYLIAILGLIYCTGTNRNTALQAYLISTGATLLVANAAGLYRRWHESTVFTRAVAELLFILGVPVRRVILSKVILSGLAGLILLIDLCLLPILAFMKYTTSTKPNP